MASTSHVFVLVLLAVGSALAQAAPARLQAAPRAAINPQPLPPRHLDASARDAINPQPLPPRHGDSRVLDAINPQPLPPRHSDAVPRNAAPQGYIGETERN
jgi:hypothetical protein